MKTKLNKLSEDGYFQWRPIRCSIDCLVVNVRCVQLSSEWTELIDQRETGKLSVCIFSNGILIVDSYHILREKKAEWVMDTWMGPLIGSCQTWLHFQHYWDSITDQLVYMQSKSPRPKFNITQKWPAKLLFPVNYHFNKSKLINIDLLSPEWWHSNIRGCFRSWFEW